MIEARFTAVLSEQRFDFPAQFRIGARQKRRTAREPGTPANGLALVSLGLGEEEKALRRMEQLVNMRFMYFLPWHSPGHLQSRPRYGSSLHLRPLYPPNKGIAPELRVESKHATRHVWPPYAF
jgi:hypothetical protein